MTAPLSTEAARELVRQTLSTVVPGAALDAIDPDEELHEALELDSLDFLTFVERLSERSGRRIEEDDYDRLGTLDSCVHFLSTDPR